MFLTSPAFEDEQKIPAKYTGDGKNINPPLQISEVPLEAKSLVLIVDDPDSPSGVWDHWLVWNISPDTTLIEEGRPPSASIQGTNSFQNQKYSGPCPPEGTHRYFFKLYALDREIVLSPSADKKKLENVIEGHILSQTELIGLYR